ncbi:MAG: acyl-CoA carboxylase subunit beta [Chloroflexota bacterium]
MDIGDKLAELSRLREQSELGGGTERIEAQHSKGKLTARERLGLLFDAGTFAELDPFVTHRCTDFDMDKRHFPGDSVVVGYGRVDGRPVFACAQDFTVFGGSLSEVAAKKICKVMDLAVTNLAPFVAVLDSGGARIQEGADSLHGYGEIFTRNTIYSGTIPQISVIVGPTAGGAVYSPAITDFVFMVEGLGQSYITGPGVVREVTGEEVSLEELGGAMVNATKSGNCHFVYPDEKQCFSQVRRLLGFLPQNYKERPPLGDASGGDGDIDEGLRTIVPVNPKQTYNMRQVIERVVDEGDFMEVHEQFARNVIVGFARLGGRSVGVVAQQPSHMAGVLDIDASDKAARFVRVCDAFNVPLITFVDVPGYMPGTDQEFRGIIRHGAKLLFAYAEATVPKISIVVRKAYGGAYVAMSSKGLRSDVCYAWPTAEIAVMGPEGAVGVLYRSELKESDKPEERRRQLIEEYRGKFASPYAAASRGYIDDVIDPAETRPKVIRALQMLENKTVVDPPKRHSNIPL